MTRQKNPGAITRRRFVQGATLAGVALAGAPGIVSCRAPSEKMNVVIIGSGGRGRDNMAEMLGENIVALCDVSEPNLLRAAEKAPKAKQFRDFRKLYDELKDSEFDAVVVKLDRAHARLRHPTGPTAEEARLLREAADAQHPRGPADH